MTQGDNRFDLSPQNQSTDWEALARRVTGESSPEESARIDAWLAGHPEQREILATLDDAMSRMADDIPRDIDIEGALARVKARRDTAGKPVLELRAARQTGSRHPVWRVAIPALAASGILAIGLLTWQSGGGSRPEVASSLEQPRMLATGVGVRDSLELPDGSRVVLGPLSSVKIGNEFTSGARVVEVAGDAWFEVVHDESRPFTVRAGNATIVDVGTKFTVRSDALTGVSVSVTEGAVSLAKADVPGPGAVILNAGDNGLLQNDGRIVTSRGTVTEEDAAWMSGRLVFREAPMTQVVSSVKRWYGIDLKLSEPKLADRRITATFDNETPEAMLDILRLVLGAEIQRRGDTAIVSTGGRSVRSN
jgi:transmembrane sensor